MKKPKWLKQISALGWDLDGTLYPPSDELSFMIKERIWRTVAQKKGWDFSRAKEECQRRYKKLGSNTKTVISFGIDGLKFFVEFWDEIDIRRFIKKDERIVKMIHNLKDKRQFIISNSNRIDQIEKKLSVIGLKPSLFEFIVSTVDLGAVKPDPKPFLVALERLELEPQKVLFVGDREDADILGARGVGMRTCFVWGESDKADVSLDSVYGVGRLFGQRS
jgi:HAD superfamily hydrolase (TIGR01549 family)